MVKKITELQEIETLKHAYFNERRCPKNISSISKKIFGYYVGPETIRKRLKENGFLLRNISTARTVFLRTSKEIEKLKDLYVNQKKSATEISLLSQDIFGYDVKVCTIYKALNRNQIPIRDHSEATAFGKSELDYQQSFLNEKSIAWIDGLMLGDGSISPNKNKQTISARLTLHSSQCGWTKFSGKGLKDYNPTDPIPRKICGPSYIDGRLVIGKERWEMTTKSHPDLLKQRERWYMGQNEKKLVPEDVRITPDSLLLWYLGDGYFTYNKKHNRGILGLSTDDFSKQCLDILQKKLFNINIESYTQRRKGKGQMRIMIKSTSFKHFFDFIGWSSPFEAYRHKFLVPEWYKLYKVSEITSIKKEQNMVRYWIKTGELQPQKTTGGNFNLFEKQQIAKVQDKLTEYRRKIKKRQLNS